MVDAQQKSRITDGSQIGPRPSPEPVGETPPDWKPVPSGLGVAPFQGFSPKYAMEGFDTQRTQDVGKSAKDAFAYLSNAAPPPPIGDKNALAVWFTTYIKPGMMELGHNVTDVDGDKFRFNNWQGDFWVDYGRGAGAPNGALAWQADYAQGGPASQAYNHTQRSIMGVPNSYTGGAPTNAKSAVLQPLQQPQDGMDAYYQYLQSLIQGQEQI